MGVPEPSEAIRARLRADPELAAYVDKLFGDVERWTASVSATEGRYRRRLEALLAVFGGDVELNIDLGAGEARFAGHALIIEEATTPAGTVVIHRMRLVGPEEVMAGRRADAQAIGRRRAEQLPPEQLDQEREQYRAALSRAKWREDGKIMRLVATNKDGGAVLASIDLSDQWRYEYTLANGRTGAGWPLADVQRHVRKLLREAE